MAKVQIKSEKLTPFGGIFSIMEQFDALLAQTIDSSLGLRCTMFGYQYSEILRFNQRETLERIFKRLEASEVYISRARMDCGSCSEET